MRKLVILRGIPGSGKSTWIKENNLETYTLSSDHIRQLYQAPVLNLDGEMILHDYEGSKVWKTLMDMLETRMGHGEFVIVDATNTTTKEILRYKELANQYRYRIYCVDFSDITPKVAKERNAARRSTSRVPDYVIDKMYNRLKINLELPSGIIQLKPNEFKELLVFPVDLSSYKKVHNIGDIHGCFTVLMDYLKEGIKEDEYYIFTGDYVDRGIENAKVINFLISIMNKPNVLLLEGNHEKWLRMWSDCKISFSNEFETYTRKELERENVKGKAVRSLCRKLAQCAFYKYQNNTFVVSHAGISTIPNNLLFVSTKQMIEGVGGYADVIKVEKTFDETMPFDFYQIHGHRNNDLPVHASERNYNLEGKVEFGGALRCIQIDRDGIHTSEILNSVYNRRDTIKTVEDAIEAFRHDSDIKENQFGDISSFNFTRKAFEKARWNSKTITARGLYINTKTKRIQVRGYNKFFNIGEVPETNLLELKNHFKFPLQAYVKENGYLGLLSFNKESNDFFITSKSDVTSPYAAWFRKQFFEKTTEETRQKIKEFILENNVTLLFEVVDVKNDPHIIDYKENEIFLLDIIHNDLEFSKYSYKEMVTFAEKLNLKHKLLAYTIQNWDDFSQWYKNISQKEYQYEGKNVEGFVIEDRAGFMVKVKLEYYQEWKHLRSLKDRVLAGHKIDKNNLSEFQCEFYDFIQDLYDTEKIKQMSKNICDLRKEFFKIHEKED